MSQDAYDQYCSSHHGHVGLAAKHPLATIEFEANVHRFMPSTKCQVLEIGFGKGETLQRLHDLGYENLEGWDISKECVDTAQALGVPAVLRHVDAVEAFVSESRRFDVILAKDLLEHLPRDQVVPFIRGMHRVLAPGGVFLARLPNMANPLAGYLRYDDFTHRVGFTENSIRQVFTLAGFERDSVMVLNDVLPGVPLLKAGLLGAWFREKISGPVCRWFQGVAVHSQRKGPARVKTLRMVLVVRQVGVDADDGLV